MTHMKSPITNTQEVLRMNTQEMKWADLTMSFEPKKHD